MVMDKPRSLSNLTYLLLVLELSCYNIVESKCPNMCAIGKMLHEIKNELAEMKGEIKCLKENKSIAYKNCAELYKAGKGDSGVFTINPDNAGAFDVYCDQTTAGGGWTVFQKKLDGSVDFNRDWDDYKRGFGNLHGEFWLGLGKIHQITKQRSKLRVDLEDFSGKSAYAEYNVFGVGDEGSKYKLSLGTYSGTAGDSISYHRGMAFSTKDLHNDRNPSWNCASLCKAASLSVIQFFVLVCLNSEVAAT